MLVSVSKDDKTAVSLIRNKKNQPLKKPLACLKLLPLVFLGYIFTL